MRWRKLGRVYAPDGHEPWARSHAMIPTPVGMPDGGLRIYFASCDDRGVGRIGYADLDPRDPTRILRRSEKPVLDIGRAGCFDDNGVNPTCAIWRGDELWLYYVGYQLGVQVRYTLFSGLAISRDGGESFTRISEAPILERCDGELLYRTAPFVLRDGSDNWRMLYIAGDHEVEVGGKAVPSYHMREVHSADGRQWTGPSRFVLGPDEAVEHGLGRPFVVSSTAGYELYFSTRTLRHGYRLAYAISVDGRTWQRDDAALGLDVSPDGWDSEAISFSAVTALPGGTHLFYNGNGFGQTGFGVAIREA
ncbi:hypothetical protein FNB15_01510 [Ferrovibrio terrae]|uniref:Exo-alpha-sialidase n=2 Tax=Ferrovibrio terrae TaxID=2594003 RepID=A0A516H781_9PROT|nr:hypothetical protein FNB15_01510 [Ferrovibrio terrae]